MVLAFVIDGLSPYGRTALAPGPGTNETVSVPRRADVLSDATPVASEPGGARSWDPRHRQDRVMRDVFGVFDEETGSLYLLEVDRTQTTIAPVIARY
jgi:hypothetical protein